LFSEFLSPGSRRSAAASNQIFSLGTGYHITIRRRKTCDTVGEPFLKMPASKRETWQLRMIFVSTLVVKKEKNNDED
jgi:hypothetical protein